MAKITAFKTDLQKEQKGIWVTFAEDIQLLIASRDTKSYQDEIEKLQKPHLRRIRMGNITPDEQQAIILPAIAKHLLIGWKNLEDEAGKQISYSVEKSFELLNDPENKPLLRFVMAVACDSENYRKELIEESVKNS